MLVLSDGAPSDTDAQTLRDLVKDTRRAVHAAAQRNRLVCGLIADPGASPRTRRIFGVRRHHLLARSAP